MLNYKQAVEIKIRLRQLKSATPERLPLGSLFGIRSVLKNSKSPPRDKIKLKIGEPTPKSPPEAAKEHRKTSTEGLGDQKSQK